MFPWWGGSALFVLGAVGFVAGIFWVGNGERAEVTIRVRDKRVWFTRSPKSGDYFSTYRVITDGETFSLGLGDYAAFQALTPGRTYRVRVQGARRLPFAAPGPRRILQILHEVPDRGGRR